MPPDVRVPRPNGSKICIYNANIYIKICINNAVHVSDLKRIIIDQREEIDRIMRREKIIEREIFEPSRKLAETDLIKVIKGIRRCGKSVFSFQLLGNRTYGYINFDDERLSALKSPDLNVVLEAFYELYGTELGFVFLDEVQNVKNWELFVNRLKRTGINVTVTGSNAGLLGGELAARLTGRYVPIELFPFSFSEFLKYNDNGGFLPKSAYGTREISAMKSSLQKYVGMGGFPEVVRRPEFFRTYLSTLYSTILAKDIIMRHNIKLKETFREISNYLLSNFAGLVSYNKLKNVFGLKSAHTSKNYVSYLEESYLIFTIGKFSYKMKETIASQKKIYGMDTGMLNAVGFGVSENSGKLLENVVAIELKRRAVARPGMEIYYWRDYTGREVDFVLKEGFEVKRLIQACSDVKEEKTRKRETDSLVKALEQFKLKEGLIITEETEGEEKIGSRKIRYVPLWKWLLLQN